jgi:prepilin signal peptidase PulO-like enzyme (type II secretory pathway)
VLTALLAVGTGAGAAGVIRSTAGAARTRRLWWVGAVAAAAAAAVAAATDAPVPVGSAIAGAGLAAAAVVDGVEGRVPAPVAYGTSTVAGGSLVAYALLSEDLGGAVRAAALTGLLVAGCAVLWVAGAMGFGDVRLAAGTATAMLGGPAAVVLIAGGGLLGTGLVAVRRRLVAPAGRAPDGAVGRRPPVAFAPSLAVAWLVAVVAT